MAFCSGVCALSGEARGRGGFALHQSHSLSPPLGASVSQAGAQDGAAWVSWVENVIHFSRIRSPSPTHDSKCWS